MGEVDKLIKQVNKLDRLWEKMGDGWMLFSHSGSLVLVDTFTGEVVESFSNIHNDGGDPDTVIVGDKIYMRHYMQDGKLVTTDIPKKESG